jgi:hypothetical protein
MASSTRTLPDDARFQSRDDVEQRRLAAAAAAEQHDELVSAT